MRVTCEYCGREHELFWLERKGGKRTVVYRCDKVERRTKDLNEIRTCTRDVYWSGQDDRKNEGMMNALPTVCTIERKKELLGRGQFQLIMTYDRPRESGKTGTSDSGNRKEDPEN